MSKIFYRIVRFIVCSSVYIYSKIVYRVKVVGKENIPKTGPVIFCSNHKSFLDPPLIQVTCKRDDTRFLAKEELTKNPFFAFLGKAFNVILVKRNEKDLTSMKEAIKTLKQNNAIAIFPEGTRNGLKKGIKPKTGVSYFALNTDSILIPIGINGGEKPFQKTTITYGKPLILDEFKENKKDRTVFEKATSKIMEEIIKLAN